MSTAEGRIIAETPRQGFFPGCSAKGKEIESITEKLINTQDTWVRKEYQKEKKNRHNGGEAILKEKKKIFPELKKDTSAKI